MRDTVLINESNLLKLIKECLVKRLNEGMDELSKQTYQNAARKAYEKGKYWGEPDNRVKKFRQAGVDKHREEHKEYVSYGPNFYGSEETQEKYLEDNQGNKLIIFDSDYANLTDLYNGVKSGALLIHCREVDENNIPRTIYPEFGPTVQDAYGCEFDGDDEEYEKPELIFASENFNWAKNFPAHRSDYTINRNGVFFVYGDEFEKSIGDGYLQSIDGQIYMGDDTPITVETNDWFSSEPVDVAAVMILA